MAYFRGELNSYAVTPWQPNGIHPKYNMRTAEKPGNLVDKQPFAKDAARYFILVFQLITRADIPSGKKTAKEKLNICGVSFVKSAAPC